MGSVGEATPPLAMILICRAPGLDLLARGLADLGDAVDHASDRAEPGLVVAGRAGIEAAAEIGMAAGLRQRLARNDEARPENRAFLDG